MDEVFSQNEKEWFVDELNTHDRLKTDKFWDIYVWMNLLELQEKYKEYFDKIDKIPLENLNPTLITEITRQKTRYLKMIMWIWDKYEGWAHLLKKTDVEFEKLTSDIVNFSGSNWKLLNKLKQLHKEIDDNDWQSTTVENSYKTTMETLHRKIYDRLAKDKNVSDRDLIFFAKIITWRWRHWLSSDIDDNLRDPDLAEKVLLLILQRKGWAVEKIVSQANDDPEIKNENPKNIIDNLKNKFYNKYWKGNEIIKLFNKNLKAAWYEDVLNIPENKNYSDLSFYQKTKLSVLYRVSKKLDEWKSIWEMAEESWTKALSLENPMVKQQYILQDFSSLFNLVAEEYIEEVADKLDDKFTSWWGIVGKDAEDFWLTWTQAEAFSIFQDIRWAWLFDISDSMWEKTKSTWKFAWVMIVAMAVPMLILPSATLVAQWAAAWAASSVAWWVINPHWYDTIEEAAVDLTTDLALWTATWAVWWAWAWRYEWLWYKALSKNFYKNDKMIMAWDLTFLWLWPEVARMKWISWKYQKNPLLEKEEK